MSRDAITEIEQRRQKNLIEQTLIASEAEKWDKPRLLKINARLVKEKHEQVEQIQHEQKCQTEQAKVIHLQMKENKRLKEALEQIAMMPTDCGGGCGNCCCGCICKAITTAQNTLDKAAQPQGGDNE